MKLPLIKRRQKQKKKAAKRERAKETRES